MTTKKKKKKKPTSRTTSSATPTSWSAPSKRDGPIWAEPAASIRFIHAPPGVGVTVFDEDVYLDVDGVWNAAIDAAIAAVKAERSARVKRDPVTVLEGLRKVAS